MMLNNLNFGDVIEMKSYPLPLIYLGVSKFDTVDLSSSLLRVRYNEYTGQFILYDKDTFEKDWVDSFISLQLIDSNYMIVNKLSKNFAKECNLHLVKLQMLHPELNFKRILPLSAYEYNAKIKEELREKLKDWMSLEKGDVVNGRYVYIGVNRDCILCYDMITGADYEVLFYNFVKKYLKATEETKRLYLSGYRQRGL